MVMSDWLSVTYSSTYIGNNRFCFFSLSPDCLSIPAVWRTTDVRGQCSSHDSTTAHDVHIYCAHSWWYEAKNKRSWAAMQSKKLFRWCPHVVSAPCISVTNGWNTLSQHSSMMEDSQVCHICCDNAVWTLPPCCCAVVPWYASVCRYTHLLSLFARPSMLFLSVG